MSPSAKPKSRSPPDSCVDPVIVSGNRFHDIKPYVEKLYAEDSLKWGSIMPWEFPQNATREEEEAFLRTWFSDREIHVQGGAGGDGLGYRFLKQVWYSVAIFNFEDRVPLVVQWWLDHNTTEWHDPKLRDFFFRPDVGVSTFFLGNDRRMYGEKFLRIVVPHIQARLRVMFDSGKLQEPFTTKAQEEQVQAKKSITGRTEVHKPKDSSGQHVDRDDKEVTAITKTTEEATDIAPTPHNPGASDTASSWTAQVEDKRVYSHDEPPSKPSLELGGSTPRHEPSDFKPVSTMSPHQDASRRADNAGSYRGARGGYFGHTPYAGGRRRSSFSQRGQFFGPTRGGGAHNGPVYGNFHAQTPHFVPMQQARLPLDMSLGPPPVAVSQPPRDRAMGDMAPFPGPPDMKTPALNQPFFQEFHPTPVIDPGSFRRGEAHSSYATGSFPLVSGFVPMPMTPNPDLPIYPSGVENVRPSRGSRGRGGYGTLRGKSRSKGNVAESPRFAHGSDQFFTPPVENWGPPMHNGKLESQPPPAEFTFPYWSGRTSVDQSGRRYEHPPNEPGAFQGQLPPLPFPGDNGPAKARLGAMPPDARAHRGAPSMPPKTLRSYQQACKVGCDRNEVDPRCQSATQVVVFHVPSDATREQLKREFEHYGPVNSITLPNGLCRITFVEFASVTGVRECLSHRGEPWMFGDCLSVELSRSHWDKTYDLTRKQARPFPDVPQSLPLRYAGDGLNVCRPQIAQPAVLQAGMRESQPPESLSSSEPSTITNPAKKKKSKKAKKGGDTLTQDSSGLASESLDVATGQRDGGHTDSVVQSRVPTPSQTAHATQYSKADLSPQPVARGETMSGQLPAGRAFPEIDANAREETSPPLKAEPVPADDLVVPATKAIDAIDPSRETDVRSAADAKVEARTGQSVRTSTASPPPTTLVPPKTGPSGNTLAQDAEPTTTAISSAEDAAAAIELPPSPESSKNPGKSDVQNDASRTQPPSQAPGIMSQGERSSHKSKLLVALPKSIPGTLTDTTYERGVRQQTVPLTATSTPTPSSAMQTGTDSEATIAALPARKAAKEKGPSVTESFSQYSRQNREKAKSVKGKGSTKEKKKKTSAVSSLTALFSKPAENFNNDETSSTKENDTTTAIRGDSPKPDTMVKTQGHADGTQDSGLLVQRAGNVPSPAKNAGIRDNDATEERRATTTSGWMPAITNLLSKSKALPSSAENSPPKSATPQIGHTELSAADDRHRSNEPARYLAETSPSAAQKISDGSETEDFSRGDDAAAAEITGPESAQKKKKRKAKSKKKKTDSDVEVTIVYVTDDPALRTPSAANVLEFGSSSTRASDATDLRLSTSVSRGSHEISHHTNTPGTVDADGASKSELSAILFTPDGSDVRATFRFNTCQLMPHLSPVDAVEDQADHVLSPDRVMADNESVDTMFHVQRCEEGMSLRSQERPFDGVVVTESYESPDVRRSRELLAELERKERARKALAATAMTGTSHSSAH